MPDTSGDSPEPADIPIMNARRDELDGRLVALEADPASLSGEPDRSAETAAFDGLNAEPSVGPSRRRWTPVFAGRRQAKEAFMTTKEQSAELATGWIEAWIRMDIDWLRERLAPDFVHTSPFGRLEGRDHYLETVEPMARKSVQELEIKDVVAAENRAAVWFENRTAKGVIPSCDWVRVEDGKIKEIQSFYDSVNVRGVLSSDEQENLGDS